MKNLLNYQELKAGNQQRELPESHDIIIDAVNVTAEEEKALVEIVYTKRADLSRQMVRIQFR